MNAETTAEQAQQALLEEFEMFDNWMDRYQYIIDMGKQLPAFPDEWKVEELKIQAASPMSGCIIAVTARRCISMPYRMPPLSRD